MKKIAFILALVMILGSALWGCDTAETDTTGQAGESSENIEDTNTPEKTDTNANTELNQPMSEDEVIDSILKSLEHSFGSDEVYTSYNLIDEKHGYFFFFIHNSHLTFIMQTNSGGDYWLPIALDSIPDMHWEEKIICAKMLDADVGFISGSYYADDCISDRTYITTNGGQTWNRVVLPQNDYYTKGDSGENTTYISSCEAYDLVNDGEKYVLFFRLRDAGSADGWSYFQYYSTDLKSWTFVK